MRAPARRTSGSPGLRCRSARDVAQRRLSVPDPTLGVGPLRRTCKKRPEVLSGLLHITALEQQEGHPVVGAAETLIELQRALVVPDCFLGLARLGEGDGHIE